MPSCVDGWRGSNSIYMQIRLKIILEVENVLLLSPCWVNNLTKSQVGVEHILLAFQSSQCNVTVYVMSLLLVLSNFSAFGFPTCVFGALSITLSNSTDTVVGKINYSERWILRHIVYSDLNFSSASVRREGRGAGGLLYDTYDAFTWSFWTSEHLLMLLHLGPDTELICIYYICFRFTFFGDRMPLQKVLFWCGSVRLHTSLFGI